MGRWHKAWILDIRPSTNQEAQSQASKMSRGDATSYDDQKKSGAVNENVTSS